MNQQEKYKYSRKLTCVVSTGLTFIEDSLEMTMNEATDLSYLRSFYMLMSYNFELILKSRIVMLEDFVDKNAMIARLKELGHNINEIAEALKVAGLEELGISKIEKNAQYKITTTDSKKILVEDFIKIRYDFLDDVMRRVDNSEHKRLKEYMETLIGIILKKAKEKNEENRQLIY